MRTYLTSALTSPSPSPDHFINAFVLECFWSAADTAKWCDENSRYPTGGLPCTDLCLSLAATMETLWGGQ